MAYWRSVREPEPASSAASGLGVTMRAQIRPIS